MLVRPVRNDRTGRLERAITAGGVYKLVRTYLAGLGCEIRAHALRAMAGLHGHHYNPLTVFQDLPIVRPVTRRGKVSFHEVD